MGRKGDLLRQQKQQATTYTFTREQLMKHDMEVQEKAKARWMEQYKEMEKRHYEEVNQHIQEEWAKRQAQFESGDRCTDVYLMLQYMLSICVKVLCDDFQWGREKKGKYNPRLRINKFADGVADELGRICATETEDIRDYSEKVFEEYGIKFKFLQEDA